MASEFLIEDAVIWTSSRPSPQPGYMAVCDGVIAAIGSGQSPPVPKASSHLDISNNADAIPGLG
jgi:predicted amidohydrolase YtcJ